MRESRGQRRGTQAGKYGIHETCDCESSSGIEEFVMAALVVRF